MEKYKVYFWKTLTFVNRELMAREDFEELGFKDTNKE
jgi:hypothetical protein